VSPSETWEVDQLMRQADLFIIQKKKEKEELTQHTFSKNPDHQSGPSISIPAIRPSPPTKQTQAHSTQIDQAIF
jgi:hypothetical protein